jgi:uncharacterized membrane-anchored protein
MSEHLNNAGASERPWPVVLLTGLGAWLAAIPILASLVMLVGEAVFRGIGPYVIGILALAGSVALLRNKALPLFVEQLAVPILLMGGISLGIALFRDMPDRAGAAVMAALSLAVAFAIPRAWLATLLGAAACGLLVMALGPNWDRLLPQSSLFSLLGATALWLVLLRFPHDHFATLDAVGNGWVLATLLGLAFWSGMTFLAGASIDPLGGNGHGRYGYGALAPVASLVLAVAAAAWLAHRWPSLRRSWSAGAALVVIGLAWLMPSLGAVMLILAVCATHGRWRLAATAGLAAAWIIGAFYYQLAFSLATKAAIMVGAGAVLGALAWLALGGRALETATQPTSDSPRARLAIAACAALVLALANFGIWQKQTLIAEGRPVFVELAPVDPRSLMQGDYMRLAFRLPSGSFGDALTQGARRPHAIGKIDARGVATLERVAMDATTAPGEIAIEMTPVRNGWTVVTDAWYFSEGDAARWERAKYGEFRVTPDGRALLVGLRGAALEPLLTP